MWRGNRAIRSGDRAALRAPHRRLFFMGVRAVGRLGVAGGGALRYGPDDTELGGRRWSVCGRRRRHRAEPLAIVVDVRCPSAWRSGWRPSPVGPARRGARDFGRGGWRSGLERRRPAPRAAGTGGSPRSRARGAQFLEPAGGARRRRLPRQLICGAGADGG